MATKSVLKSIAVKDRKSVRRLERALEYAEVQKADSLLHCAKTLKVVSRSDLVRVLGEKL